MIEAILLGFEGKYGVSGAAVFFGGFFVGGALAAVGAAFTWTRCVGALCNKITSNGASGGVVDIGE